MKEIVHKHHISFKNAFSGLKWALTTQPNFRVHLILALLAIVLGTIVHLSTSEWILLTFTIFWALGAEMINTSLEAITDLVTREWREEARIAKDVSAGMMLVISFGAIVVACFLILPKLFILI